MFKINCLKSGLITGTIIMSLVFSVPGFSATVSIDSQTVAVEASEVQVPVSIALSPGDNVSGLNMSISFISTGLVFKEVKAGSASIAANKTLSSGTPSNGVVNLVIYSMDSNLIQDGALANLSFEIPAGFSDGQTFDIAITDCVLSDSSAKRVAVSNKNGSITITNTSDNSGGSSDSGKDKDGSGGCFISSLK